MSWSTIDIVTISFESSFLVKLVNAVVAAVGDARRDGNLQTVVSIR